MGVRTVYKIQYVKKNPIDGGWFERDKTNVAYVIFIVHNSLRVSFFYWVVGLNFLTEQGNSRKWGKKQPATPVV